jgi:ankyrin repeat protein
VPTAFQAAIRRGDMSIVQLLLEYRADVNASATGFSEAGRAPDRCPEH